MGMYILIKIIHISRQQAKTLFILDLSPQSSHVNMFKQLLH